MTFVIFTILFGFKYIKKEYDIYMDEKYAKEIENISEENLKVINNVIQLATDRVGQEYTWGGKGEIITSDRLDELISEYGQSYYPLDREIYIGKQGFDCSGLTYWTYKTVTGVNIGYSTVEQKEVLNNYKVDMDKIQPGDLIYVPGHVVMYIGRNKIVESANQMEYPIGGIKITSVMPYKRGDAYRPIEYINTIFNDYIK